MAGVIASSYQRLTGEMGTFQLWNSRSCQLVLGAGAMTTASLKTITASNLGMSSDERISLHHLTRLGTSTYFSLFEVVRTAYPEIKEDTGAPVHRKQTASS